MPKTFQNKTGPSISVNSTPVNKFTGTFLWALFFWALLFLMSLKFGVYPNASWDIVLELRLPRAILATAVGIGLSLSGATLQALYSNPLCDPYILGISSGAALGAAMGVTLGIESSVSGVAIPALMGALLFGLLLQLGSRFTSRTGLSWILLGLLLGSFGSSLVSIWMTVAEPMRVQNLLFWMLGDLSRTRLASSIGALGGISFFGILLWTKSKHLDALLLGESGARALGIETMQTRRVLVFMVAVLVALSVSCAGMIGFIGLVVPHFARLRVGAIHGRMLPFGALCGAVAMLLADLVSRMLFMPYELPVGAVTALLGAPCLVLMILKLRRTG